MFPAPNRRQFLKFGAAATAGAALPENLKRALAVAPNRVTGTLQDVEHVVILMQENRSFDHYFGCLQGVRGIVTPAQKNCLMVKVFLNNLMEKVGVCCLFCLTPRIHLARALPA